MVQAGVGEWLLENLTVLYKKESWIFFLSSLHSFLCGGFSPGSLLLEVILRLLTGNFPRLNKLELSLDKRYSN